MPSDPNIILEAGNLNNPQQQEQGLISMFGLAQAVKQAQRQDQRTNALRDAFTNPNSVDATTGLPTPTAIRKVMSVDPELGVKLQDDALEAQVKRAQAQHYKTEAGKNNFDFMSTAAGIGYDAYTAKKKAGGTEDDALVAGRTARNDAVKNNGGVIGDDVADGIISKPFDPAGARALAGSNKEWLAEQRGEQAVTRQEAQDKDRDRRADQADRRLEILASKPAASESKWVVEHDAKAGVDYRYNPATAEATTLDGKPYTPQSAAKQSGGSAPRSSAAAFIQKYMDENPHATSADIAHQAASFREQQSEGGTIGTRAGAADVAAQEVKVFAKQAIEASNALPRENLKILNRLIQAGEKESSDPRIQKLLIATDALVNARARAISPTGQPHVGDQITGRELLSTLIGKMGYEAGVQQFEKEAEGVLESTKASKAAFAGSGEGGSDKKAFIEGHTYTDAKGNKAKYTNGKFVEVP